MEAISPLSPFVSVTVATAGACGVAEASAISLTTIRSSEYLK